MAKRKNYLMRTLGWCFKIGTAGAILLTLSMFARPASAFNQEKEELRIDLLHDRELRAIQKAREFHETLAAYQLKISMIKNPEEVRRQSKIVIKSIQEIINLYLQEIDLMTPHLKGEDSNYSLMVIKNRQSFINMLEKEKTKWQGFLRKGKADPL